MSDPVRGPARSWQYLALWRDGALDLDATLDGLPRDDLAAALLLSAEYPGELHWVPGEGQWYVWDGRCHRPDSAERAGKIVAHLGDRGSWLAGELRRAVSARVMLVSDGLGDAAVRRAVADAWKPWEPAVKYLTGLRRSAGRGALMSYLAVICGTNGAQFAERHPHWLNCANGTVDLVTGRLKPHDPADMISYCLSTAYVPGASCEWFSWLAGSASGCRLAVTGYMQRMLGYCCLGSNPEQLIFFLLGPTASGKTQLLEAVSQVLEVLAHNSQDQLIAVTRTGRNARVEWSLAGKRLVTITETSAHLTIDEGQVKRLTGERHISVDKHYSLTEIKVPVSFTIVGATNEMPVLTNFDEAMRRRAIVIPCGQTVRPEDRVKDLAGKIVEREAEGILAWLVAGAMAYFASGLQEPAEVLTETGRYIQEQDTVGNFLADCVMPVTGYQLPDGQSPWVMQRTLWDVYQAWSHGSRRLGKHAFLEAMRNRPEVTYNEVSRRFEGIVLLPGDQSWDRGDITRTWNGR